MGIPPFRPIDLTKITDVALRDQVTSLQGERDTLNQRIKTLEVDSNALQSVRAEASTAKNEVQRLTQVNAGLKTQSDQVGAQLAARTNELQQVQQGIAARDVELTSLRASDAVGKQAIANQTKLTARVAELSDQMKARDTQIADLSGKLGAAQSSVAARDTELTQLRASDAVGKQAVAERTQLNTRVGELTNLVKARDAVIGDLNDKLSAAQAAAAAPPGRTPPAAALSVNTVATNVGMQVSQAQQALKESSSGFALANVSVRLKVMAEDGGKMVRMLGADEVKSPEVSGALDEFHLDFAAQPTAASEVGKIDVPDLSGLTQSAAQRVLAAVGLRLDPATGKPPASSKAAIGQAFKQSPDAGAKADRGLSVLVVFAQ